MNRIIASVGLVALGATGVQAQSAAIAGPAPRWWSVAATVRGFYDDNVNTVPNPGNNDRSYGYEIAPHVGVSLGNAQTTFTAAYTYSFLYYEQKPAGNSKHYDQDHTFDMVLAHQFSERYSVTVRNAFVIGQQPDTLRSGNAVVVPFRISGNNIVNYGGVTFNAEITRLFGIEAGYNIAWYDYANSFNASRNIDTNGVVSPSTSGILDRIEQTPYIEGKWHFDPETTARLGYQYGQVDYTANELVQGVPPQQPPAFSDIRNNRSHTVYLGVDHVFCPTLTGSAQAGASYYDYYNLNNTSVGPYARLSLTYTYAPESSAQIGFQEGRTASDVLSGGIDNFVRDTESSVVFASVSHRIVPHLYGNLNGSFQNSSFNGGGDFDGKSEQFYEFGADLEYRFNTHISAHAGYDYDKLESQLPGRSYDRNKVYIGATASY